MEHRDGVVVITGEAGTWYPVHETEGTARLDAELDAHVRELAKPHIAADKDYFDWRYGPQEVPTRLQRVTRVLRRIF